MNPEQAAIKSLDRRTRGENIEEAARELLHLHDKIGPKLEAVSVNPDDFTDLHDPDSIESDKKYVARMRKLFSETENEKIAGDLTAKEVKKIAEILEYLIMRGINIGKWIPFFTMMKTAEVDDIREGVDGVLIAEDPLEKSEDVSYLGLSIDISFAYNLDKKFTRIKEEIDNYDGAENGLGHVKYFYDRKRDVKRELHDLPRVVVALDIGVIKDLARAKEGGKGHIARHAVILEIERQLAVYADYARKNNPLCLEPIMRAQNMMHQISLVTKSREVLEQSEYTKNTKTERIIERNLDRFR